MLASLFACILIVLLTYYQVFKQGLFSSLINAIVAIIAALVAFNYFEPLSAVLIKVKLASYGPQAIAFFLLFTLSMLIMRELTDRLIRGNMNFSLLFERVGGAVFGFVASMVVVGTVVLGFQLLPIGSEFLMFDRYGSDRERFEEGSGMFPYADSFVLSIVNHVSANSFSGPRRFNQDHPDFLRELYADRLVLDPGSRREAAKDSIRIRETRIIDLSSDFAIRVASTAEVMPSPNKAILGVKVLIRVGTNDDDDRGARDVDGHIRIVMGNFRLVGYDTDDRTKPSFVSYPLGTIASGQSGRVTGYDKLALDKGRTRKGDVKMELLFHWPCDNRGEAPVLNPRPLFLEFRRSVRVAFPAQNTAEPGV